MSDLSPIPAICRVNGIKMGRVLPDGTCLTSMCEGKRNPKQCAWGSESITNTELESTRAALYRTVTENNFNFPLGVMPSVSRFAKNSFGGELQFTLTPGAPLTQPLA